MSPTAIDITEDRLKDYIDRKQANFVESEVRLEGTIAHSELIGPHHLVVFAKMKTCTLDASGSLILRLFEVLALLFDAYILGGKITFHMQIKRYFVSREDSQSDTIDGARLVMVIFKSIDMPSSFEASSYSLNPGELYKLISVGDQIEILSGWGALIRRKVRPRYVDIGPDGK